MVNVSWLVALLTLVGAPTSIGANTTAGAPAPLPSQPVSALSNPDHTATLVFAVIAAACAACTCVGVWWKPQLLVKMVEMPGSFGAPTSATQEHTRPLV